MSRTPYGEGGKIIVENLTAEYERAIDRIAFGIKPPRVIYAHADLTKMRPSNGDGRRDRLVAARLEALR